MRSRRRPPADTAPLMMEELETRLPLYGSPFLASLPALSDMGNTANTVVRLQTNEGFIDIELYDRAGPNGGSTAPITTANFLQYINSGRFANTFFHRLVANFVVQGGGFEFTGGDTPPRVAEVVTDPKIQNEFNVDRTNAERTIAMAKLDGDPNSATSQFFFNLKDNAHNIDPDPPHNDVGLDVQNGGFTVFGRVIHGWETVQTIAGLQARDLGRFLTGEANAPVFSAVPVTGAGDADLVFLEQAGVIKAAGSAQFLSQSVYFPDGFRSGNIAANLDIVNSDPNAATPYQIIVHYESGRRDQVIFTNTLAPGEHIDIPISKGGTPSINKVRAGEGFSYEIRSARPIAASLHHTDFGATTSGSFIQTDPFQAVQLQTWPFAGGVKGPNNPSYIVWENLSDQDTTVYAYFFPDGGAPFMISKTVAAYRRGGLNINELAAVPDGTFSLKLDATNPIVATLSQYSVAPAAAALVNGQVAGASPEGVIAAAYIPTGGQALVSALFTEQSPPLVTISFDFILGDGTVLHNGTPFTLSPSVRRRDLNLASAAALPLDTFFTIRYHVETANAAVAMSYSTTTASGQHLAMPFQTFGAGTALLADGFTDPTRGNQREFISIYNPYVTATTISYRLRFHFASGADDVIVIPAAGSGQVHEGGRVDINTRDLAEVIARTLQGAKFRRYSVFVDADITQGSSTITGAMIVQLSRFDDSGDSVITGPTLPAGATVKSINDPSFH